MKALTLRQPWAWAILYAGKDIENRDWHTAVRGRIAIHAAQGMTQREYRHFSEFYTGLVAAGKVPDLLVPAFKDLPRGVILGTALITNCLASHPSPWFFGHYGFVLQDVIALPEPIPCQGMLGFWEVPKEIAEKIRGAL